MATTKKKVVVDDDQKDRISNRIAEIIRQVFLQKEYPFDPELLIGHLQAAVEGRFGHMDQTEQEKKIFAEWSAKWPEFWDQFVVDVSQIMSHPNFPKQPIPGFPWIIVDPGLWDDEQLAEILFKKLSIPYYVSVALMEYGNSAAPKKVSVIMVRDTIEPDQEYLGKSADDADAITADKGTRFLLRRHWIILFSFLWWLTQGKQKLDAGGGTRFPGNRLSGGRTACGYWRPGFGGVELNFVCGGRQFGDAGPREGKFFTL